MILQALRHLAQREGLMKDPDYEPKPVAWLVRVSEQGKLLGIQGTHEVSAIQEGKKKSKRIAKQFFVPREKPPTMNDRAFLLFNKAEYVFGIDPQRERDTVKLQNRFRLFREKVKDCLAATGDDGVRAVYTFLEDLAAARQSVALPDDCAPNDLFAFVFAPDIDCLVSDRPKVREYWIASRKERGSDGSEEHRCLVSGAKFSGEVENFPLIEKIPGANPARIGLVSFNSSAFESYGWKGNDNASVSREAAEACATALNRLLHPAYPIKDGLTLPRRNLKLSSDTVVCYWTAEASGDNFSSAFGGLLEANPDDVKELYHSIWRGKQPHMDKEETSAFYALTLSGTQGRAIVRDWFESTVANVVRNLALHFGDLSIVRSSKPDLSLPMTVLLESLSPQGDRDKIPPHLAAQMVEAALHGTPYPFSILQRAVERTRAEIGKENDKGKEAYRARERTDARAALIKAVLNRRKRFSPQTTTYQEVQPDMDPTNTSEGYTLGRLMAVLERIQQEAIGDVNASVVDRYFSGASANPKTVFVRLLKNSRHHVSKARDDDKRAGFVFRLDKLVDELASQFDPKHNGFPAYLDLDQQGLFVLGYHQMRKWLWMSKEERTEWEQSHRDAPKAYLWAKEANKESITFDTKENSEYGAD